MKRCPKCNADYFDNMLEFCLEDGTKLTVLSGAPVTVEAPSVRPTAAETVAFSPAKVSNAGIVPPQPANSFETIAATRDAPKEQMFGSQASKIIEMSPIVLALMHNWWQWLYVEKEYVYSIASFLLSASFLTWLLLLAAGTAASVFVLKKSENKIFGYISLVVLAINLIMFLVPRK